MLDFSAGQISFEARQLALQAGPFLALALALALTFLNIVERTGALNRNVR